MPFIAYEITNIVNDSRYIGITKKPLAKRIAAHFSSSLSGRSVTVLSRAIRKYGKDNFSVRVVAESFDYESLKILEMLLIDQEKTRVEFGGYNLTDGGDGTVGWVPTPETREKIRSKAVDRMSIQENRENIRATLLNYHTPETRKIVSDRFKGKTLTDEHKLKVSRAGKGRIVSDVTRGKLRNLFIGKPRPKHVIEILTKSNIGRKATDSARSAMSRARLGKPKSEEHKLAIKTAHRKRQETMKSNNGQLSLFGDN